MYLLIAAQWNSTRAEMMSFLSLLLLTLQASSMSASDVEDDLPNRQITSAEPSIPLRQSLERNILGVFEIEITPSTFDPKGRSYLDKILRSHNLQPLRETTPFHIDMIEDAFVDHQGISR